MHACTVMCLLQVVTAVKWDLKGNTYESCAKHVGNPWCWGYDAYLPYRAQTISLNACKDSYDFARVSFLYGPQRQFCSARFNFNQSYRKKSNLDDHVVAELASALAIPHLHADADTYKIEVCRLNLPALMAVCNVNFVGNVTLRACTAVVGLTGDQKHYCEVIDKYNMKFKELSGDRKELDTSLQTGELHARIVELVALHDKGVLDDDAAADLATKKTIVCMYTGKLCTGDEKRLERKHDKAAADLADEANEIRQFLPFPEGIGADHEASLVGGRKNDGKKKMMAISNKKEKFSSFLTKVATLDSERSSRINRYINHCIVTSNAKCNEMFCFLFGGDLTDPTVCLAKVADAIAFDQTAQAELNRKAADLLARLISRKRGATVLSEVKQLKQDVPEKYFSTLNYCYWEPLSDPEPFKDQNEECLGIFCEAFPFSNFCKDVKERASVEPPSVTADAPVSKEDIAELAMVAEDHIFDVDILSSAKEELSKNKGLTEEVRGYLKSFDSCKHADCVAMFCRAFKSYLEGVAVCDKPVDSLVRPHAHTQGKPLEASHKLRESSIRGLLALRRKRHRH